MLTRYVLKDFLYYFSFSLCLFSLALVSADALLGGGRVLFDSGKPSLLLPYMLYRLPPALGFSLPMACMLGSVLTVGRLSGSRELLAIRCGGVSFTRALAPILVVSGLVSLALAAANLRLIPACVRAANSLLASNFSSVGNGLSCGLESLPGGQEMLLSARRLEPGNSKMSGLCLNLFWEDRRVKDVYAESAEWNGEEWLLSNVVIHEYGAEDSSWTAQSLVSRTLLGVPLPNPMELGQRQALPDELSARQLYALGGSRVGSAQAALRLRFHQRFSIAAAGFVFAIFCCPFAVVPYRSGLAAGFGSALGLCAIYYVVAVVGGILCGQELLPAALAAWLPNLIFLLLGIRYWIMEDRK